MVQEAQFIWYLIDHGRMGTYRRRGIELTPIDSEALPGVLSSSPTMGSDDLALNE